MRVRSIASLGVVLVLTACTSAPKSDQATVTAPSPAESTVAAQPAGPQAFPKPVVSPLPVLEVPSVPGLIRPTNARMRVPGIATGRSDPFAAIATDPIKLSTATQKPTVKSPSPLPAPRSSLPSLLPTLPPPPNQGPLNAMPPVAPPSRTAMAEAIEVSGAVQVGGKWSVIVKEPNAVSSRSVRQGAYLANGQVMVKRIVAGAGTDPIVILQQNGIEVTKSVGSSGNRIASK